MDEDWGDVDFSGFEGRSLNPNQDFRTKDDDYDRNSLHASSSSTNRAFRSQGREHRESARSMKSSEFARAPISTGDSRAEATLDTANDIGIGSHIGSFKSKQTRIKNSQNSSNLCSQISFPGARKPGPLLRVSKVMDLDANRILSRYSENIHDDDDDFPRLHVSDHHRASEPQFISEIETQKNYVKTPNKVDSITAWQKSQAVHAEGELDGLTIPGDLKLSLVINRSTIAQATIFDSDNEDWPEGSLGIRHAKSHQDRSTRASTGSSNLSVSISSAAESEDRLDGLELPESIQDLKERFRLTRERRAAGDTIRQRPKPDSNDTLLDGLVLAEDSFVIGPTLKHRNLKRLPLNKVSVTKPSRLPIAEHRFSPVADARGTSSTCASRSTAFGATVTPTEAQALPRKPPKLENKTSTSKLRSASGSPAKDGQTLASIARTTLRGSKSPQSRPAFLPGGSAGVSSHHVSSLQNRNERADRQCKTPGSGSTSPTKRRATASEALRLEASRYQTRTHVRAKTYGEGHELDDIDDLPVSVDTEKCYNTAQSTKATSKSRSMKYPAQLLEKYHEPRNHSRTSKPKDPTSSLKALRQSGASVSRTTRKLDSSASKQTRRPNLPGLISAINGINVPKVEKDMVYNPKTFRWEGNENDEMKRFDTIIISPPRPALISNVNVTKKGLQIVHGMVFDPDQMSWVKLNDDESEVDPFESFDELQDGFEKPKSLSSSSVGRGQINLGEFLVGEEFDVGPVFVKRQRDEEVRWRKQTSNWLRLQSWDTRVSYLVEIYDLLRDE